MTINITKSNKINYVHTDRASLTVTPIPSTPTYVLKAGEAFASSEAAHDAAALKLSRITENAAKRESTRLRNSVSAAMARAGANVHTLVDAEGNEVARYGAQEPEIYGIDLDSTEARFPWIAKILRKHGFVIVTRRATRKLLTP